MKSEDLRNYGKIFQKIWGIKSGLLGKRKEKLVQEHARGKEL